MRTMQISNVTIDVPESWGTFEGKPMKSVSVDKVIANSLPATFTAPDGLILIAGLNVWPDGQMDMRSIELIDGPDSYRRLEQAGRLEVKQYGDDTFGAYVRALRIGGKEYPTLGSVTWQELDGLLETSATEYLESLGATALGTAEDVLGSTSNRRNQLAMTCPKDDPRALFAMWGMTRVLAVMKGLGSDLPGVLG